jgi:hypothetical protein
MRSASLTVGYQETGSIYEGKSPETAQMVCGGTLVAHDLVLTAAHCLKNHRITGNRFWFFLQSSGTFEADSAGLEFFCDTNSCTGRSGKFNDIALMTLRRPVLDIAPATLGNAEDSTIGAGVDFVGFGVNNLGLFEYNLKRHAKKQINECEIGPIDDRSICFDLQSDEQGACHLDSGSPLYSTTPGRDRRLIGVAVRSGPGCKVGQARYNSTVSTVFRPWLDSRLAESKKRLRRAQVGRNVELISESTGWLDKNSSVQSLDFNVDETPKTLLVTMNHAAGKSLDGQENEFRLELFPPGQFSGTSGLLCDNGWRLLAVCQVDSPTPGLWQARVSRIQGEGHFQLLATGISR